MIVNHNRSFRLRMWLSRYIVAGQMIVSQVTALPSGRANTRPAIVRIAHEDYASGFDPRERVGGRIVLTMPPKVEPLQGPNLN